MNARFHSAGSGAGAGRSRPAAPAPGRAPRLAQARRPARRLGPALLSLAVLQAALAAQAAAPALPPRLTSDQAVATALRDNPDLKLARLASASAGAAVETAGEAPNPTLTVGTSGINPAVGVGSGNLRSKTVDSAVRVDQLIERGGKRTLRVENATALQDAASYDAADARRQMVIAVRQAFYDLLAAQQRVVLTADSARLAEATWDAGRRRQQAGDLAPSEVTRLQVDALRATADASQAVADAAHAALLLLQVMGHGEQSAAIVADDTWPQPATGVGAHADVDAMLAARADVRAAQARVRAAQAATRLALAARTRDLSVGAQFDHYPVSATNTQGGGNTFGISVQIPLFVRNQFDGEIRTATLAADTAEATLAKTRSAARNELLRLFADERSAAERLTRMQEALLPAARSAAAAAEFAFTHGAMAVMDVLDVRRAFRQAQLDALAAQADYAKAAASLAAADAGALP